PARKAAMQPRRDRGDAAPILAEVADRSDPPHRARHEMEAIVTVVIHLPEHPVIGLGVERPIVGLRPARLRRPELRGLHAADRVADPELLPRHASVIAGQLLEPGPIESETFERLLAPPAQEVAPVHHPDARRSTASRSRPAEQPSRKPRNRWTYRSRASASS